MNRRYFSAPSEPSPGRTSRFRLGLCDRDDDHRRHAVLPRGCLNALHEGPGRSVENIEDRVLVGGRVVPFGQVDQDRAFLAEDLRRNGLVLADADVVAVLLCERGRSRGQQQGQKGQYSSSHVWRSLISLRSRCRSRMRRPGRKSTYRTLDADTSTTVIQNYSIPPTFTIARYATAGEAVRLAGRPRSLRPITAHVWLDCGCDVGVPEEGRRCELLSDC